MASHVDLWYLCVAVRSNRSHKFVKNEWRSRENEHRVVNAT